MVADTNEAERRRWNDERWTTVWPKRERLTYEVVGYMLGTLRLQPGERVLDVGSGAGRATIAAAEIVGPEGAVVGADLSLPLTELARRRVEAAGLANVSFRVADVQTDSLGEDPFDVMMSLFGVMFFDDPVEAFGNLRAQLVPGGRIAFACWESIERNPWFAASALADFVPPPPVPAPGKSPTGPFAFADPVRTASILQDAGFVDVARRSYEIEVEAPEDSVIDDDQLVFMGVSEERLPDAQAAVEAHMDRFRLGSGLSRFPLAFQVFQARNTSAGPAGRLHAE